MRISFSNCYMYCINGYILYVDRIKMELEDQVVNLELSVKLKELGVKQESLFYWFKDVDSVFKLTGIFNNEDQIYFDACKYDELMEFENYSAFISSELGKMLPWDITISRNIDKQWHINFCGNGLHDIVAEKSSIMSEDNEANSRAKMIIYLIENGYIKNELL